MNLIVAVDKNWGIGKDNDLLISIPEDMEYFKEKTMGKVVIMGKNTLESFPGAKPLKNRTNIVLALETDYLVDGATVVYTMDDFLKEAAKYPNEDVFVIGGGSIYRQMLEHCDTCYITYIDHSFDADTFIPNLDEMDEWYIAEESEKYNHNGMEYSFRTYKKK
jgi:dihydrofolate reductase